MLVQLALVVFVLFGVAALTIDLGFVRLSQSQMQTAADAAALEGLRQRDIAVTDEATGDQVNDPFAADCIRRASAHRLVRAVFADDGTNQFGAGPIIDLTDGVGTLHALQTISAADPGVYDPDLQLNQRNRVDGDMVSGEFCYSADPSHSESANYDTPQMICSAVQRGAGRYARNDFNPSSAPPDPPASLECPAPDDPPRERWPVPGTGSLRGDDHSAFLVRLRRSNELGEFPGQTDTGVATSGPTVPLLFGRATAIAGDGPDGQYSVRRDGFTVRATAIAEVRPALRVGLPVNGQRGVTPLAVLDTFIQNVAAAGAQVTLNPANGIICSGLACAGANPPTAIGRFVDNLTDSSLARWATIATVGLVLPASTPVSCAATAVTFSGYGPVYAQLTSGTVRIIGFTRMNFVRDQLRLTNPCAARITHGVSLVAPANATASLGGGLPVATTVSAAEVREIFDRNMERQGARYAPLLVPVLAR